jgi:hypothetical protein
VAQSSGPTSRRQANRPDERLDGGRRGVRKHAGVAEARTGRTRAIMVRVRQAESGRDRAEYADMRHPHRLPRTCRTLCSSAGERRPVARVRAHHATGVDVGRGRRQWQMSSPRLVVRATRRSDVGIHEVQRVPAQHLGHVRRGFPVRRDSRTGQRRDPSDQGRPNVALEDQMWCSPTVVPVCGESHIMSLPA